ncbi:hypothetical protein OBBRIDRAFT_832985 [Obba rivulosa]|uniref:Uncharacterized protein n=1 Tax=Obba rivulosa TaxID=1052685 RepID=A0A8E2B351_9APHY|nr:hypothetical protein OBBRIDRAFT_832985 [Obba rivulosa]
MFRLNSKKGKGPAVAAAEVAPDKKGRRFSLPVISKTLASNPKRASLPYGPSTSGSDRGSSRSPFGSVGTSASPSRSFATSAGTSYTRATSPLSVTSEDAAAHTFEVDESGLPTYFSATYPTRPVAYQFEQVSPFAMTISCPDEDIPGTGKYYVSVGLNVWMPSSCVTTVKRNGEDGPFVAKLELGITTDQATVTMASFTRTVRDVLYRKSTFSSSRLYYIDECNAIKWRLGSSVWQAHHGLTPLATFTPTVPRKLVLQPTAHRWFDHIVVGLLILMREHLTPRSGEAAALFNYSAYSHITEEC